MQERMQNIAMLVPDAFQAMLALGKAGASPGLPPRMAHLVHLRASQINGCSVCLEIHSAELKKDGETDKRMATVAAWRETPWFSEAERAALALTEALTRLSDRPDPVPDAIWDEAARHFDEAAMAALIIQISAINVWNRWNAATRQMAGAWN